MCAGFNGPRDPDAEDLNERNAVQELARIPIDTDAWCAEQGDGNPDPSLGDRRPGSDNGGSQGGRKNGCHDKKKEGYQGDSVLRLSCERNARGRKESCSSSQEIGSAGSQA